MANFPDSAPADNTVLKQMDKVKQEELSKFQLSLDLDIDEQAHK